VSCYCHGLAKINFLFATVG